jgi:hypothetical protein
VEGVRQVAEILNRLPNNRTGMVELLRAHDPEVVSQIEMSMYDFFILSRQTEQVISRLLDEVPLDQWAIALKGAEPALRDAILTAMPKRQAQSFEDLMRRSGPVPMSRIEQTRKDIMVTVKALADSGEIDVQLFAEATAECSRHFPHRVLTTFRPWPRCAATARAPAPASKRPSWTGTAPWPKAIARASATATRPAWMKAAPTAPPKATRKGCSAAWPKARWKRSTRWASWASRSMPPSRP